MEQEKEEQKKEDQEENRSIFSTVQFKLIIVFVTGALLSFIASRFIPYEEVIMVGWAFAYLTIFAILGTIFKLISGKVSFPLNVDLIVASFVLGGCTLFLKNILADLYYDYYNLIAYFNYASYAIFGIGFFAIFVLICRLLFRKKGDES